MKAKVFSPSNLVEPILHERDTHIQRWHSLRMQSVSVQEKLKTLLNRLEQGIDWDASSATELEAVIAERNAIAQQIGFFVMSSFISGIEIHTAEEQPEQLSLFKQYQETDESLLWLQKKIDNINAPNPLDTEDDILLELSALEKSLYDISSWHVYGAHHQQVLLEQIVARLRYIHEECVWNFDKRIRSIFHRITDYSKRHTPGFIHGLSLHHKPNNERWLKDAQESWKVLKAEIQKSPEKDSLQKILPLLVEPIDIEKLEEALLTHRYFWGFANTIRRLAPHVLVLQNRPKLHDLVYGVQDYLQKLNKKR